VFSTFTLLGDPAVLTESSQSDPEVQRKLQSASVCFSLLQHWFSVSAAQTRPLVHLCEAMIIVWMFITQVISADKSCQMAVGRLNA
jgi:uncharacterized membrane protein (DUF106 family)